MRVIKEVYKVDKRMNFIEALQKACEGQMIARLEWYNIITKGVHGNTRIISEDDLNLKFVFRQVPTKISLDIVPKMTSLPEQVKAEFLKLGKELHYQNQFAMVGVFEDRNEIHGWRPTEEDKEATDWVILSRAEAEK